MEPQPTRDPTLFSVPLIQFFVGLFLFIALLQGQRDLSLLAILVLVVVSGAKLWSRMSLSRILCRSQLEKKRIFPGESFGLEISVANTKFLPLWLEVKLPLQDALCPLSEQTTLTKSSGLLWFQEVRFAWKLVARKRGIYPIGPPNLKVSDLLGFFPRQKELEGGHPLVVYPRLVPLRPLSPPRRDFFGIPGGKSPVQDPIYILGTRDYLHFEPARHIHWKASARHNRLQQKLFEPSEQEKVMLLLQVDEFAENKAEEAFEQAVETIASLAVQMHQAGFALGLHTNAVVMGEGLSMLPVTRSPHQIPAILEALAGVQMAPRGGFLDTLQGTGGLHWGVSCVHFSYGVNGALNATKKYFSYRNIPTLFFVCRGSSSSDRQTLGSRCLSIDDIRLDRMTDP